MNVLVISPHTDDAEMGAGGTIVKLVEEGHSVTHLALSTGMVGVGSNSVEFTAAAKVLGVQPVMWDFEARLFTHKAHVIRNDFVSWARGEFAEPPDLVLIPSSSSYHEDHVVVCQEARRAFRTCNLLGYETPWSDLEPFTPHLYVKLAAHHAGVKLQALQQYKTQVQSRHYFTDEVVLAHITSRGMRVKAAYAEAFEVFRWIL